MLTHCVMLFAVVSLLLLSFTGPAAASSVCEFQTQPLLVSETPEATEFVWNEKQRPELSSETPSNSEWLQGYRRWISTVIGDVNPLALLARQRGVYRQFGLFSVLPYFDAMLAGSEGETRPVSCLESLLLAEHFRLRRTWKGTEEFAAFTLTHGDRLEILFSSRSTTYAAFSPSLADRLSARLREGWEGVASIHNHPFYVGTASPDVAGTTIASQEDLRAFADQGQLGVRAFRITNGFHTLVLGPADVLRLAPLAGSR